MTGRPDAPGSIGISIGHPHSNTMNRKVFEMEPRPLYVRPGKKTSNTRFFRNFWCSGYDQCLNRAALEDLFLDCTECLLKDDVIENYSLFLKNHSPE